MNGLNVIQAEVQRRADEITSANPNWPCRKGCDDCCRSLASVPRVTSSEWQLIQTALDEMPVEPAQSLRQRIRDSASSCSTRPVVCPLLDTNIGTCTIYESRPIACRTYGFYVERESVLGCRRIETLASEAPHVVWGNHLAVQERLHPLGPARELHEWLNDI